MFAVWSVSQRPRRCRVLVLPLCFGRAGRRLNASTSGDQYYYSRHLWMVRWVGWVGAFFVARRPAEAPRNAHRWGRDTGPAARAERRCGRRPDRCHRAQPGGDRRGRPDHRRSATSVKWILSVVGQVDPALHCPAQRRRASAARDVSGVTETGTLAGPRSRHSGFTEEGFTVVDARCLAVSNRGLLHCDR